MRCDTFTVSYLLGDKSIAREEEEEIIYWVKLFLLTTAEISVGSKNFIEQLISNLQEVERNILLSVPRDVGRIILSYCVEDVPYADCYRNLWYHSPKLPERERLNH